MARALPLVVLLMASPFVQSALAADGPLDEAMLVGRDAASFPAADEDYFKGMDNGLELSVEEVMGRNMWMVWTGGNDLFWDRVTNDTFGAFDLLKTISSHPDLQAHRTNRFDQLGLINEPCFSRRPVPTPTISGSGSTSARPTASPIPSPMRKSIRVSKIGARGRATFPVGSYYGEPLGVVGLRLFPNPDFDERAEARLGPRAVLRRSRLLQLTRIWSGPTASACPAPSATWGRAPSIRRQIPRTRR